MKHEDDSLVNPPMEKLLEKIPQRYELVLTATRRAKQIIREMRLNPLAISEEDRKRKPLSIALMDIIEGRIDQQALLAPDIEFDDLDKGSLDSFGNVEGIERKASPKDEALDAVLDTLAKVDSDDDLGEVGDLSSPGDNKDG